MSGVELNVVSKECVLLESGLTIMLPPSTISILSSSVFILGLLVWSDSKTSTVPKDLVALEGEPIGDFRGLRTTLAKEVDVLR